MWTHDFRQQTTLPVEVLWPVLANVADWGAVDHTIESIEVDGTPAVGTRFMLKPKGGPRLHFTIGDFAPPTMYSDVCQMPLATMRTTHRLIAGEVTTIEVCIEIRGILAPLWGLLVGRKHAQGLPAQTERFIQAASEGL
jgi:hypothetical protein